MLSAADYRGWGSDALVVAEARMDEGLAAAQRLDRAGMDASQVGEPAPAVSAQRAAVMAAGCTVGSSPLPALLQAWRV